jgi:Kef-type K+ transport system membrane component KefB/nucleotide-binding universal stress UspA family protein
VPSSADRSPPGTPPNRRLVSFYVVFAVLTAVVAIVVIAAGQDRKPEEPINGGYDVAGDNKCLGAQFEVKQSGEFVNLQNADDTLGGKLRLDDGVLTGDVDCVAGGKQEIDAKVADGTLKGELGGAPVTAELKRDPPDPGAQRPRAPDSITGTYKVSPRSACLGGRFELEDSGKALDLILKGKTAGEVRYADGKVTGTATCPKDQKKVTLKGEAVDRNINNLIIAPEGAPEPEVPTATPEGGEKVTAEKQRETFGARVAIFFIAVTVVMLVARLFGTLAVKIRQPRVMGEVVAGIALGPTIFGALLPDLQATIFATDILPTIGLVANLGLIFYMFLVGLELDPNQLKGRVGQAAAISNASVALPLMLGFAVALPIYELVGPDKKFVAFALYMGVAMSITAFPVLARILVERRMLKRPVGALTMACAAIDDVTAWFLIALATAVAAAGSGSEVAVTIALAIAFCAVMGLAVRPLLSRAATAYDEAGRVPGGWVVAIFAGILLSAWVTEEIGIAVIFGAFIMGMIMPRHAELTEDVTHRVEDFVIVLLLPLFFAYTGLRTNIGLLDRPELWLLTGVLIVVAIVGKWVGAMAAARFTGFSWRDSGVIGVLMNTRGLTELIVLNLALEAGVISEALFAMLVIMALVTTFMAGPLLNWLDPKNELGAPVEEELEEARMVSSAQFPTLEVPERSILLAPEGEPGLEQLRAVAEPLGSSEPPRELILARLVLPPRGAGVRGGLQTENRLLEEATRETTEARDELISKGIAARAVAFISADPGADLSRLAEREEVDLMLMDGQRPLLGEGVPRGAVGKVLEEATCDVAVLVARQDAEVAPGPDAPVITPFGGAEHDWAALELSAWISSATGAPLKLLGAAGEGDGDGARVTRLLGDAGLLIQQYAGVTSEPIVARPGREGVIEAAEGAGLLVVGLSDRWRDEGLGPTRSEIARSAPAPVLFVRRGTRTGALAPRSDVTRFSWSAAGAGGR